MRPRAEAPSLLVSLPSHAVTRRDEPGPAMPSPATPCLAKNSLYQET
jgi:hypothetical protein